MGKPTETELKQALAAAIQMREGGTDPDFIAKSLLNLHYRVLKLERVMTASRRYLHAGQSTSDHRALMQAIHAAEEAGTAPDDHEVPLLGRDK